MARPITDTLRMLHGGLFIENISDLFAGVVRSVDETGKAGKLTITLDIKKVGAAISVTAKATDKVPEKAPDSDLFYATVEGNLTVDNPAQRKLDLRMADAPTKEVRSIDPETGGRRNAGDVGTDVLGRLIQPPTEPLYAAQGDSNMCGQQQSQGGAVLAGVGALGAIGQLMAEQRQSRITPAPHA